MRYKVNIDEDALTDIQQINAWYNNEVQGLGNRFVQQTKSQINSLWKLPLIYTIRYSNVRCMLIKHFPFMVHFTVDTEKKIVVIFAIIHTSRNPKIWEERNISK